MADIFSMEVVYPKGKDFFHSARVRAMVLNAMKSESKFVLLDFESTTEHWIHKPKFTRTLKYAGGDVRMTVHLAGSALSNKYWMMVNNGTLRRYVIFDKYYQAKTQVPGSFHTNVPGFPVPSNGVQVGPDGYYHRKIWARSTKALKGIRARNWTQKARDDHKRYFKLAIDEAIRRGLRSK